MRLIFLFLGVLCFSCFDSWSQTIKGSLSGEVLSEGKPIPFATAGLTGTGFGATADATGIFSIPDIPVGKYELQVSALGFKPYKKRVSVSAQKVWLKTELEKTEQRLEEVVVTGTMKETFVTKSPITVEVYTPKLFQKNPSPSIFEAMQMVNGVQPQLNCNVCNTGDIHINGMEGPYTMVTIDGMPIVSSLGSVYGLSGIPNSLIQRVEVVKGPASTLYGSEAVGGLINIITKSPVKAPVFAFDLMTTSYQEYNADLSFKKEFKKAQVLTGLNGFYFDKRFDLNHDNFTDVALQRRVSVFQKWNFTRAENRQATVAARYLYENRWGGEQNRKPEFRGGDSIYGESVYTSRAEIIGTYQLPIPEKVTLQYSYNLHNQNSAYGKTRYVAQQQIAFAQLLWDKTQNRHDFLVGIPFRFTFYDDNTPGTRKSNLQNKPQYLYLPGIFAQDEITLTENLTALPGLRYDYNSAHGNILSPRVALKLSLPYNQTFRLNFGNGYRVVNLFTEDHAALTGARETVLKDALKPERSWNGSLNYQKFINTKNGFLNVDGSLFYTYFTNRIIGDFNTDPNLIIYQNLRGYAISRGITMNFDWQCGAFFKLNAGATVSDVFSKQEQENGLLQKMPQLHAPVFSGTYALTFSWNKPGLTFDYTGRIYSPMTLPVQPLDFRASKSPWFALDNFQVTKKLPANLEIYGGVKNIFNFMPENPLMRPFDPFNKNLSFGNPNNYTFDTAYNYAPLQKRRVFLGIRWQLSKA